MSGARRFIDVGSILAAVIAGAAVSAQADPPVFLAGATRVWTLADLTGDGDYLDANERALFAEVTAASFVTLTATDSVVFAVDPASSSILMLIDRNGDGDALDFAEATTYLSVSVAAASRIASAGGVLWYWPGTGTALLRIEDRNGDGDVQDAGEVTTVSGSMSGLTALAPRPDGSLLVGFNVAATPVRVLTDRDANGDFLGFAEDLSYVVNGPAALDLSVASTDTAYLLASGSPASVYRLYDWTGDDDCLDRNEVLPFATAFVSDADAAALWQSGGQSRLLVLRRLSGELLAIEDRNGDGDASDAGEVVVVANGLPTVAALAVRPETVPGCRAGDANGDGQVTTADKGALAAALLDPLPPADLCRFDANGDGQFNGLDIQAFAAILWAAAP